MAKYQTGGKVSGDGGQTWGGTAVDVGSASVGTGTRLQEDGKGPGGVSTTGTASSTK